MISVAKLPYVYSQAQQVSFGLQSTLNLFVVIVIDFKFWKLVSDRESTNQINFNYLFCFYVNYV